MRKNFNAQKYNKRMDKLFNNVIKTRNKWDKIRQLEIDYMLAEDKQEKQALRISMYNLQRGI
jgi:UDP-N-acetylglucosamine pyrophosphorylase